MISHALTAPTLDDIEALARRSWIALPEAFRRATGDLVFRIEDFPDDQTLDDFDIEDAYDLTGLYVPSEIPMVFLYRRPILNEWVERGDVTLNELVTHVLVHEVGHHLGLTDEAMDAILAVAG